mmetsp:Transcript_4580/g.12977  ORF Transcript_4580/g.12977 Transcript_4580/m.12977 type:complete len:213 (+) Transcript_4580:179-817(+)
MVVPRLEKLDEGLLARLPRPELTPPLSLVHLFHGPEQRRRENVPDQRAIYVLNGVQRFEFPFAGRHLRRLGDQDCRRPNVCFEIRQPSRARRFFRVAVLGTRLECLENQPGLGRGTHAQTGHPCRRHVSVLITPAPQRHEFEHDHVVLQVKPGQVAIISGARRDCESHVRTAGPAGPPRARRQTGVPRPRWAGSRRGGPSPIPGIEPNLLHL